MKILLTSGGTKISLDAVRSLTNMSRGTFGSAICKGFLDKGHSVDFLMAEDSVSPFNFSIKYEKTKGLTRVELSNLLEDWLYFIKERNKQYRQFAYKTFEDYDKQISKLLADNNYDIVVLAAAVSDFGVANYVDGKIRSKENLQIILEPLPKIISKIKQIQPKTKLVGFKLLVNSKDEELLAEAEKSISINACDMVVANDLRDIKNNNHRLLIVKPAYNAEYEYVKQINCVEAVGKRRQRFVLDRTLAEVVVDESLMLFARRTME